MKKYDEISIVRKLKKNPGIISINTVDKLIEIAKGASSIGNKTNGKIDFLTNYCGYIREYIDANEEHKARAAELAAKRAAKKAKIKARNKNTNDEDNTNKFSISSIIKILLR